MMTGDVIGRIRQETQIWHEICCNSLKRRAQEGWRSRAVYCPHVSHFSSSKDTCTMLVSGPSLPVRRYVWSFSRSRQPLLRHRQFRSRKPATNPLPFSTWRYGQCTYSCALGVGISGSHPDTSIRIDASNASERAMPTGGPRRNLAIQRNSYAYLRRSGRAILRYTLELLIQYWFSVVTLPERRSPC